jgi:acetyl esterase/lipase
MTEVTGLGGETEPTGGTNLTTNAGKAIAFPRSVLETFTLEKIRIKTASGTNTTPTSLRVAICKDNAGKPGTVIEEKVLTNKEVEEHLNGNEGTSIGEKEKQRFIAGFNHTFHSTGEKVWIVLLPIAGGLKLFVTASGTVANEVVKSTTTVTEISGVVAWEAAAFVPAGIDGKGAQVPHEVTVAKVTGGGGASVSARSVRTTSAIAAGGGGGAITFAQNPPRPIGTGGGNAKATASSVRKVTVATVQGGGTVKAPPVVYGQSIVYRYSAGAPFSQQNLVVPIAGLAPSDPSYTGITCIFLHESSEDEPSVGRLEAGTDGLPREGEAVVGAEPKTTPSEKLQTYSNALETRTARGWACFIPTYRTTTLPTVPNMGNVKDLIALVEWVKAHCSAWNGDPNKVVIIGGSYGTTLGTHIACRLNKEREALYIRGVAGLSGPVDLPVRVRGRDEEQVAYEAAQAAWEAAHPGFTPADLKKWEEEYGYPTTDIVGRIANQIETNEVIPGYPMTPTASPVSLSNMKKVGWLEETAQKKLLELAEALSAVNQLGQYMPYIYYSVSLKDLTPQSQMIEMENAAAAHGQPGRFLKNNTQPGGHGYEYWGAVQTEVWNYLEVAVNPPKISLASVSGGGASVTRAASVRPVKQVGVAGGGQIGVTSSTTRSTSSAVVSGGGQATATRAGFKVAVGGGGRSLVAASSVRRAFPRNEGGGAATATAVSIRLVGRASVTGGGQPRVPVFIRGLVRGGGDASARITPPVRPGHLAGAVPGHFVGVSAGHFEE